MPLNPDITERVGTDFGEAHSREAMALLEVAGGGERIARCLVQAASGDLDALRRLVAAAGLDYRDVIMAGEYGENRNKLRDLRVSFLIDAPEKFWIADLAAMLANRGYALHSLTTPKATVDSVEFVGVEYEGIANFSGSLFEIMIEKSNRKWKLHGDAAALEIHGLHEWFDDEAAFSDTLSGYLLVKQRSQAVGDKTER